MTTEEQKAPELLVMDYVLSLPCRFDAGRYMGRFLVELRDNKKIWANKCPSCGRITCPPVSFCDFCHGVEMTEWLEQNDEGVLRSAEVVLFEFIQPSTGQVQPVPWAHGNLLLDTGASLGHYLAPPDPTKLKRGERYKVVWKEEGRVGDVHDIQHFKAVEEGGEND